MPQKIKRQIKRSMPLFVIFSLLTSTVAIGLVFNFDINFYNLGKDFDMSFSMRGAQAQQDDYASTTVEVRNAPPAFTAGPTEVPTSTSTTPVNDGASISFAATSTDDESNNYYLAICKTNSITASTSPGGAPDCAGGQELCISGETSSGSGASCTHSSVDGSVGEIQVWYAFVCDNHAIDAACSSANQGSGDGGSPFYINHAPYINAIQTSVNNLAPGGRFYVQGTSTDSDVMGGANELTMTVCDAQGYATSTGDCSVGSRLCWASSTAGVAGASTTVTCWWDDSAPTPDANYPYYVYFKDEYHLGATNNGVYGTYTVINVAPQVTGVYLVPTAGYSDIQLAIKDAPQRVVYATSSSVTDQNGCADLVSATATIYWSNATGEHNCVADDDDCYPITSAFCSIHDCSGAIAQVTCTTTIEYHAKPTDASSNWPTTIWLAGITVWDEALYGTATTAAGTELYTAAAHEVTETLIDYGQLMAGTDSGTDNATTTITNFGNCPIDIEIEGKWMTQGAYHFGSDYQEYSTSSPFTYGGALSFDLSSTTAAFVGLDCQRATTTATDQLDYLYWGIGIPAGQFSGVYNGENTFTVDIDANGNWN